jgi:hypothetical protein
MMLETLLKQDSKISNRMFIKDFDSFLNEAEGYNGKGIFTVATLSQKNLFVCEISGQLSDGAWENTKPYDHWTPWAGSEVKVGSRIGRDFPVKKDGYGLGTLLPYVGDRMLAFGAAGSIGWDLSGSNDDQYAVEYFFAASSPADLERKVLTGDFEKHFQDFIEKHKSGYSSKYVPVAEKNKKKLEETWNAIRSGRYGIKQLQRDLTDISKAMKIKY